MRFHSKKPKNPLSCCHFDIKSEFAEFFPLFSVNIDFLFCFFFSAAKGNHERQHTFFCYSRV